MSIIDVDDVFFHYGGVESTSTMHILLWKFWKQKSKVTEMVFSCYISPESQQVNKTAASALLSSAGRAPSLS